MQFSATAPMLQATESFIDTLMHKWLRGMTTGPEMVALFEAIEFHKTVSASVELPTCFFGQAKELSIAAISRLTLNPPVAALPGAFRVASGLSNLVQVDAKLGHVWASKVMVARASDKWSGHLGLCWIVPKDQLLPMWDMYPPQPTA